MVDRLFALQGASADFGADCHGSEQCLFGCEEVCVAELLLFLRREVVAGDEAATGEAVFREADLDQFSLDTFDSEH